MLIHTMAITCTPEHLIERLHSASASDDAFTSLRSFVYGYYWAEEPYAFSVPQLEGVFAALSAYFESEAAFGDPGRSSRMKFAAAGLEIDCSAEGVVAGLERDEIGKLLEKHRQGEIAEHVLWRRLKGLTPVTIDVRRLLDIATLLQQRG